MLKEPETEAPERVWYNESRTINLGQYESVKIETGYATSVTDEETVVEALKRCRLPVREALNLREKNVRARIKN